MVIEQRREIKDLFPSGLDSLLISHYAG